MLDVVGGLAVFEGLVLMGLRPKNKLRPGMWEYPGGKVDPGEDHVTALVREWREELGIAVRVGQRIGDVPLEMEVPFVWTLYHVMPVGPEPFSMLLFDAQAHEQLDWVSPLYAIQRLPCTPTTFQIYPKVRDFLIGPVGSGSSRRVARMPPKMLYFIIGDVQTEHATTLQFVKPAVSDLERAIGLLGKVRALASGRRFELLAVPQPDLPGIKALGDRTIDEDFLEIDYEA